MPTEATKTIVQVYSPDDGKWRQPIDVTLNGQKDQALINAKTLRRAPGVARELAAADGYGPAEVKTGFWHRIAGGRTIVGRGNRDGEVSKTEVAGAQGISPEGQKMFQVLVDRAIATKSYVDDMKQKFAGAKGAVSATALQQEYESIYMLIANATPFATDDNGVMGLALPRPPGEEKVMVRAEDWNLSDVKQDLAWRGVRFSFERESEDGTAGKPWLEVRYGLEDLGTLKIITQGERFKGQVLVRTIVENGEVKQTSRVLLDLETHRPRLLDNHANPVSDAASASLKRLHLVFDDLAERPSLGATAR